VKGARLALVGLLLVGAPPALAQETPQTGAPADWPVILAGAQVVTFIQADRLEGLRREGAGGYLLDAQGWRGTDSDKLWWKAEGEGDLDAGVEGVELQGLYSRMISPFFDLQLGVRQDATPDVSRTHAVVGIQGLAPYWFEVDAAMFVSHTGDVTARLEAEYELLLTQRLVLQPRAELNAAFQDVEALDVGAGLSSAEFDLRLRYEISRQVAPYVGVSWFRAVGNTADFARADSRATASTAVVAGLRLWY